MVQKKIHKNNKGFTLVEIMVAVSIFAVIMVISAGSIVSIFDANKKSQTLRTVMDNLSLTMESMVRTIRFGTKYHCDITTGVITEPRDCFDSVGSDSLSVLSTDGDQISYSLDDSRILREKNGTESYYLTSNDVTITDLSFWVYGSLSYADEITPGPPEDPAQPMVIIVIRGFAGDKPTSRSEFTLQTEVSQRSFDFQ